VLGLPKRTFVVIAVLVGVVVLYVMGNNQQQAKDANAASPAASASACKMTVTADILKVRSGPDIKAQEVGRFKQNAEVDAEKVVQNGFRKLSEGRWVSNEYVKPMEGRDCG
jgi:hypothetical protein